MTADPLQLLTIRIRLAGAGEMLSGGHEFEAPEHPHREVQDVVRLLAAITQGRGTARSQDGRLVRVCGMHYAKFLLSVSQAYTTRQEGSRHMSLLALVSGINEIERPRKSQNP